MCACLIALGDEMTHTDENYMHMALDCAKTAYTMAEVPVGAVIVREGLVISSAYNTRETQNSALGHAELNAIASACKALGTWRLDGCTIYVTLEPCPMCAGAIINARIDRLVYAARDEAMGCCGSVANLCVMPFGKVPSVKSGVLQKESAQLLKQFFSEIRISRDERE